MTKLLPLCLWTFILVGLLSCESKPASKVTDNTNSKTSVSTSKTAQPLYPGLPQDLGMKVWNEGEMIDYLFHDLPFSMNQTEQASIQTNLTYLDSGLVYDIPKGCKPMARQFYQVGGDIILEGDIYHGNGCHFYVFHQNGKPLYANQMNEKGRAFFDNIINQAMQARQQGGPG